jgi:hypothetical protein
LESRDAGRVENRDNFTVINGIGVTADIGTKNGRGLTKLLLQKTKQQARASASHRTIRPDFGMQS